MNGRVGQMIAFNNNGMGLRSTADVINLRKPYPVLLLAWLYLRVVTLSLLLTNPG